MSAFAVALVPSISKIIIKLFLGAEASEIGGTAITVAMRSFSDRSSAATAEKEAKRLAQTVVNDLEGYLTTELGEELDPEFWAAELADTLNNSTSIANFIRAGMNSENVSSEIISRNKDNWDISGAQTASIMPILVQRTTFLLSRVIPNLEGYTFERDREILGYLIGASHNADALIVGQKRIEDLLRHNSTIAPWQDYESQYLSKVATHLDYVEILGLGLSKTSRTTSLSVAYLSLTLAEDNSESEEERMSYSELLESLPSRGNRLIVEGGAGSGKSTLLRWTAIRASRAHPTIFATGKKASEQAGSGEAPDSASDKSSTNPWDTTFDFAQRVPFLIRLRDLRDPSIPALENFPRLLFDLGPPPAGWVEQLLSSGRAVLLFDGVDELSEERGLRNRVLASIKNLSDTHSNCTFVIAGRPGAFTSPPYGNAPAIHVTVNDMDDDERNEFVTRWHRARADRETEQDRRLRILENAGRLKQELDTNSALRRMASNPLLAAAICVLHDINPSTTPRTEYEVCEKLARMLVSERDLTEDEQGVRVDTEALGKAYSIDYIDKQTIISRIAGQMLSNEDSVLSWDDALSVVAGAIHRLNQPSGINAQSLLKSLAIRSGVLRTAIAKGESEGEEALEFVHNRFKEWFGSIDFRNRNQPTELCNKLPADPFDQVSIFAVAAPGAEDFANKLVAKLRERVPALLSPTLTRQTKLTAVRLNEAARLLDPDLKDWARSLHSEMFPPRNRTEAKALSLLGDIAVPFLRRKSSWGARETAAAALCLRLIGTPAALTRLEGYLGDDRWTVGQEVCLSFDPLRSDAIWARLRSRQSLGSKISYSIKKITHVPKSILFLNLPRSGLEDISGIEFATNITEININNTNVSDLSPISSLSHIRELGLSHTKVLDLSPLSGKSTLRSLDISGTRADLGTLTDVSLTTLNMFSSKSTEFGLIAGQRSLLHLNLGNTAFFDQNLLVELEHITDLTLTNTKVPSIAELTTMKELVSLSLGATPITNFWPLRELPKLKSLFLPNSAIADINFLRGLNLSWLLLDGSEVEDIEGLRDIPTLVRLDIDGTSVSDLGPIASLSNLQTLFMVGYEDFDLDIVYGLPNLRHLQVSSGVKIDLSKFARKGVRVAVNR